MNRFKGASLVDYVIPTAVIGLVLGAGLYNVVSNNSLLGFISGSGDMMVNKSDSQIVVGKQSTITDITELVAGALGGTPSNPVKKCVNGECAIDFGDYILKGIPEDFSTYISEKGTSGGTDKLTDLLNQVAAQMEEDGNPADALEIKKLASLGHNIGVSEKQLEKLVNDCGGDSACINDRFDDNVTIDDFPGYDTTYYPFTFWSFSELTDSISVGNARDHLVDSRDMWADDYFQQWADQNRPAHLFVQQFDNLMSKDLSPSTKNVISELYWEIGRISEDAESGVWYFQSGDYIKDHIDSITGAFTDINPDLPDNPVDIYSGYKPSTYTHIDSALICASGKGEDTGVQCH